MSTVVNGIGVSPGIGHARALRLVRAALPPDVAVLDPATAMDSVSAACEAVAAAMEKRAAQSTGSMTDILDAQAMIVRDPSLAEVIRAGLEAGHTRTGAIHTAFESFSESLAAAGPYLAERVADLDDLEYRISATLLGVELADVIRIDDVSVVIAPDLAPADVASLDLSRVAAIVTQQGGATGHAAIVAKSLAIPAVVSCADAAAIEDGAWILVDGQAGTVTVDPSVAEVEAAVGRERSRTELLAAVSGPGRTSDGHRVELLTNIGTEFQSASKVDSEGVGLFRTEFMFLDRVEVPSFDEQVAAYSAAFRAFAGRKVIVRTLDAGSDKPLRFVPQRGESNPALGVRGLRVAREFPELLSDQLRAIGAAASESSAKVSVMAPMVSTPDEAVEFVTLARAAGIERVGVMAEVPALVLRADEVLEAVDFLSIGTNDLAQYAFAADRMLSGLSELTDPWQPALLILIERAAAAGAQVGKPVGVCGEAAGDPLLAPVLVGLGVTSLSMAPVLLPAVRAALADRSLEDCRRLSMLALGSRNGHAARAAVVGG
jgi:phosphotransferase system enzyme I (PtsI)